MPTVVGKLTTVLQANSGPFSKGLSKATRDLNTFSASAMKTGAKLAAAGAAILAPFALSIRAFARYGDEVAKMGRRTGLGVETVSRLGYAARIAGAELDDVEKGTKRMARTIVDANSGLTTYQRAFDRIGVDYAALQRMSPEEAFLAIGDAIAKTESPLVKAAAAQEIFGRAGTKLIPLFDLGAEGMETLMERAEKLGIVLGSEATLDAERLTDAFQDLKMGALGVGIELVESLGIPTENLSDMIAEGVSRLRKWIEANRELVTGIAKAGVALVALGGAIMAVAVAAKVLVILFSPAGVIGLAAGAILLMLDAFGVVDLGLRRFVGNVRIGGAKIDTYLTSAFLDIGVEWETLAGVLGTGFEGIGTLGVNVWGSIKKAAIHALIGIYEAAGFVFNKLYDGMGWILKKVGGVVDALKGIEGDFGIGKLGESIEGINVGTTAKRLRQELKNINAEQDKAWADLWAKQPAAAKDMLDKIRPLEQAKAAVWAEDVMSAQADAAKAQRAGRGALPEIAIPGLPEVGGAGAAALTPAAVRRGSVEAYSIAVQQMTAARARGTSPEERSEKHLDEQVKEQKATKDLMGEAVDWLREIWATQPTEETL